MEKVLVTTHDNTLHNQCWEIVKDLWQSVIEESGAVLYDPTKNQLGRPTVAESSWQKLKHCASVISTGVSVLWVDCDTMPCPGLGDPWERDRKKNETIAMVVDEPCPSALALRGGLVRYTGDAAARLVDDAMSHEELHGVVWNDERALGTAIGLTPRGVRFAKESQPRPGVVFKRLPKKWLAHQDRVAADALVFHAYGPPDIKPDVLRALRRRVWPDRPL